MKIISSILLYLFFMFSVIVAVSIGVESALKNYFDKEIKRRKEK